MILVDDDCTLCNLCILECPHDAITEGSHKVEVDHGACTECGACVEICPQLALTLSGRSAAR